MAVKKGLAALAMLPPQQQSEPVETAPSVMQERLQGTIADIVRGAGEAMVQRMHILNHNGANLAYVNKAAVANACGLSDEQKFNVTPFPSPPAIFIGGSEAAASGNETAVPQEQPSQPQSPPQPAPPENNQSGQEAPTSTWRKVWPFLLTAALAGGSGAAIDHWMQPEPTMGVVDLELEGWSTE